MRATGTNPATVVHEDLELSASAEIGGRGIAIKERVLEKKQEEVASGTLKVQNGVAEYKVASWDQLPRIIELLQHKDIKNIKLSFDGANAAEIRAFVADLQKKPLSEMLPNVIAKLDEKAARNPDLKDLADLLKSKDPEHKAFNIDSKDKRTLRVREMFDVRNMSPDQIADGSTAEALQRRIASAAAAGREVAVWAPTGQAESLSALLHSTFRLESDTAKQAAWSEQIQKSVKIWDGKSGASGMVYKSVREIVEEASAAAAPKPEAKKALSLADVETRLKELDTAEKDFHKNARTGKFKAKHDEIDSEISASDALTYKPLKTAIETLAAEPSVTNLNNVKSALASAVMTQADTDKISKLIDKIVTLHKEELQEPESTSIAAERKELQSKQKGLLHARLGELDQKQTEFFKQISATEPYATPHNELTAKLGELLTAVRAEKGDAAERLIKRLEQFNTDPTESRFSLLKKDLDALKPANDAEFRDWLRKKVELIRAEMKEPGFQQIEQERGEIAAKLKDLNKPEQELVTGPAIKRSALDDNFAEIRKTDAKVGLALDAIDLFHKNARNLPDYQAQYKSLDEDLARVMHDLTPPNKDDDTPEHKRLRDALAALDANFTSQNLDAITEARSHLNIQPIVGSDMDDWIIRRQQQFRAEVTHPDRVALEAPLKEALKEKAGLVSTRIDLLEERMIREREVLQSRSPLKDELDPLDKSRTSGPVAAALASVAPDKTDLAKEVAGLLERFQKNPDPALYTEISGKVLGLTLGDPHQGEVNEWLNKRIDIDKRERQLPPLRGTIQAHQDYSRLHDELCTRTGLPGRP